MERVFRFDRDFVSLPKFLALARGATLTFVLNRGEPHVSGRERRCLITLPMHEKRLPQPSHKYGLIPVCKEE